MSMASLSNRHKVRLILSTDRKTSHVVINLLKALANEFGVGYELEVWSVDNLEMKENFKVKR